MNGRAQGHAEGEVEFVLGGDGDGCDVLGGVADDGEDDEADEGFGEIGGGDEVLDGADEEFGAEGHERGRDEEQDYGCELAYRWVVGFGVGAVGVGAWWLGGGDVLPEAFAVGCGAVAAEAGFAGFPGWVGGGAEDGWGADRDCLVAE